MTKKVKVIQLLPAISYGDAVSNDALAMSDSLTEMGLENEIYAGDIGPRVARRANHIKKLNSDSGDIVIYHISIGTWISQMVHDMKNKKKIAVYHNITPAAYFQNYSSISFDLASKGREQLCLLNNTFEKTLADSHYNKEELEKLGYKNIYELPIIINFNDYYNEPDKKTIEKYDDGYVNILFVGRIAPNKKQEDIVKCFYIYKKFINPRSRLFLIGSHSGMERYVRSLKQLIIDLELSDVYMPGHTSFQELLSYYRLASVFLCMSEHEGFCVPLIESMFFKIPIIAYEAAAVPETLGKSGVVFKEKRYEVIAEIIDLIINNRELRRKIIEAQTDRLKAFDENKIKEEFKNYIRAII